MKRSSRRPRLLRITPFAVGEIVREDDCPQYRVGEIVSIQADGRVRVRWNDRQERTYLEGDVLDMVLYQHNHINNFNREQEEGAQALLNQEEEVGGEVQEEAPAAHEEEDQVEAPAAHEEAEVEAPALNELPVEEEKEDEEQSLGGDYRSAASSSDEESDGTHEDLAPNDTPARPIASSESTGITPAMRGMRLNGDCEECGQQLPCLFCNRFH
ncbi:predicted protein [Chaetoceros tenuissimus]|uniref:Uncharacterized protein n=1 Tax=Chaetoceros tenuissimus TaxID=426638 RepID=A0AAD3CRL0_9STRA|nr:predicted protein [Chaetoceros tenuissimus]